MPDEVRASPVELGRAADLFLTESIELQSRLPSDWGNRYYMGQVPDAPAVQEAIHAAEEAAGLAVQRLAGVLEEDVDALYQTAFAYREADQAAARNFNVGPNLVI